MKDKLKVGLYGVYGHQVQNKLYQSEHGELAALCCVTEQYLQMVQAACSSPFAVYDSLEEMLKDDSLDVISLCAPRRGDQARDAIACLRAGKHVYAEKPAALTEAELEEILAVEKETGCEFHEMADSVFSEPYWSVRQLVRSGKIGEIVQVYLQKSYPLNLDIRPQDAYIDGGLVRQVGIHAIRFLEHITGLTVDAVQGYHTFKGNTQEDGLVTAASLSMTLSNGGVASACLNYLNPAGFLSRGNECVRLFGTGGMIEITDGATRTHVYTALDEGPVDVSRSDCRDYFELVLEHLRCGTPLLMSQEEELHPLRVVIRAAESSVHAKKA